MTRTSSVFRLIAPVAVLLAAGLLLPSPARATQVRDLSLTEMARTAGPVFSGRVTAVQPDQVHGLPVIRVTFQVADGLKGVASDFTTLTFPGGGKTGNFSRIIPGMPTFSVGEDWVMLAYPPSEIGLSAPVGLHQGAFRVHGNRDGGPLRDKAGLTVVLPASPRTGVEEATPGDPAGSPVSYGAFMNRLRELTGAAPAARAVLSQEADEGEPGRDAESAAAAAARGDRRQP